MSLGLTESQNSPEPLSELEKLAKVATSKQVRFKDAKNNIHVGTVRSVKHALTGKVLEMRSEEPNKVGTYKNVPLDSVIGFA